MSLMLNEVKKSLLLRHRVPTNRGLARRLHHTVSRVFIFVYVVIIILGLNKKYIKGCFGILN